MAKGAIGDYFVTDLIRHLNELQFRVADEARPVTAGAAIRPCRQTPAAWFRREDYERIREIMETG